MNYIYLKHKSLLIFYKIVDDVTIAIVPSNKSLAVKYKIDAEEVALIKAQGHNTITKDEFDAAMNAAILTLIEISII
jgi:hypothetical protein